MNLQDFEIRDDREVYGNDARAINRHSVRCFQVPGHDPKFYLDKTLDANPPIYELYTFENGPISVNFPVNGQRYFGEGLTWNQAMQLVGKAIEDAFALI